MFKHTPLRYREQQVSQLSKQLFCCLKSMILKSVWLGRRGGNLSHTDDRYSTYIQWRNMAPAHSGSRHRNLMQRCIFSSGGTDTWDLFLFAFLSSWKYDQAADISGRVKNKTNNPVASRDASFAPIQCTVRYLENK
jgi:hypothetical protein